MLKRLLNYQGTFFLLLLLSIGADLVVIRAYVVHARPEEVKTEAQKTAFSEDVKKWIQTKVARHKFLRGGVVVIDIIPKRLVYFRAVRTLELTSWIQRCWKDSPTRAS